MKVRKVGDWRLARRLLSTAPQRVERAANKAVMQEAQFFRAKIVEGLREQAPGGQPLQAPAPTTLAIRRFRGSRGTKALIVRGDLRNSITVVKEARGAFVGVLRTAKGADGRSLVNVATVHEFGSRPIVVKLTPKARRFLHAAFRRAGLERTKGSGSSTGIAVIWVPARPFLRPVLEKYGRPEDVARRFLARVAAMLGGDFGHFG